MKKNILVLAVLIFSILTLAGCATPTASMIKVEGDPTGKLYILNTDSGVDIHGGPVNKATAIAKVAQNGEMVIQPFVDGSSTGTLQTILPAVISGGAQVGSAGVYGSYQKAAAIGSAHAIGNAQRDVAKINGNTALQLQANQKPTGPSTVFVNNVDGAKAIAGANAQQNQELESNSNVEVGVKVPVTQSQTTSGDDAYFDE